MTQTCLMRCGCHSLDSGDCVPACMLHNTSTTNQLLRCCQKAVCSRPCAAGRVQPLSHHVRGGGRAPLPPPPVISAKMPSRPAVLRATASLSLLAGLAPCLRAIAVRWQHIFSVCPVLCKVCKQRGVGPSGGVCAGLMIHALSGCTHSIVNRGTDAPLEAGTGIRTDRCICYYCVIFL